MEIKISTKKIVFWLYGLVFALNMVGFAGRVIEKLLGYNNTVLVRFFDVTEEANITSWFSSTLLLISALLLFLIARKKHLETDRFARHWSFMSVVFLYLSMDETARIHESTIKPLRDIFNATGIFYYTWIIIAIPLIIVLAVVYLKFFLALPPSTRNQFFMAVVIFLSGALGFEILGGLFYDVEMSGVHLLSFIVTIEELLENLGVVVFISALFTYIKMQPSWKTIPIEFE